MPYVRGKQARGREERFLKDKVVEVVDAPRPLIEPGTVLHGFVSRLGAGKQSRAFYTWSFTQDNSNLIPWARGSVVP